MFTDRPVLDRRGLAGRFDVELEFIRDEVPAAWAPAGDIPPPRLVPALREQLGQH